MKAICVAKVSTMDAENAQVIAKLISLLHLCQTVKKLLAGKFTLTEKNFKVKTFDQSI